MPTKNGQRTRPEQALHDGHVCYPMAKGGGAEEIFAQGICQGIQSMILELYEITNQLGYKIGDFQRAGKSEEAMNWVSVSNWLHDIATENRKHLKEFMDNPKGRMP